MFSQNIGFYKQSTTTGNFGNNLDVTPDDCFVYTPSSGTTPTDLVNWTNTSGFTCEYWVYTTAWGGAISPGPGNMDGAYPFANYKWTFGPANYGQLIFYGDNGSGGPGTGDYIKTANNALTLNTWHNIAVVCTTTAGVTTVTMYIDGVRQSVQKNLGSFADSQTITGGTYDTSMPFAFGSIVNNYLKCYMDNLRVSNINRYSGASYTVANSPFTVDSNTQMLIEPTGSVGSTTIAYANSSTTGTMINRFNFVTVSNAHYNHS
jgi:hypothetical protein